MDRDYIENTKDFVKSIKQEKVYKDYKNYKSIISKNPKLKDKLDEYMKNRFNLQADIAYGTYNSYENLLNLQRQYDDFLDEPLIQNYLKAELGLSKMLDDIFGIISENIDFDLSFLD